MADRALQPTSLLDRLLDDAPELSFEPPKTRNQQLRDTRAALRRDLEALLNTRCATVTPPAGLTELRSSVLTFGAPDFIGASMIGQDQRRAFARKLEATIVMFEPRLRSTKVTLLDNRTATERLLRLRIEAVAILEEGHVPLLFASALDPTTMRFQIGEERPGEPAR